MTPPASLLDPVADDAKAAALAHITAAARQAATIPDVPADTALRPLRQIGIIGAGTMGGGIAMSLANAGIDAILVDNSAEALDRGLQRIRDNYDASVTRGRLTEADAAARLARIQGATTLEALANADLVIEAVFEDLALKQGIFRELDRICKPGAILATNTSGLDVDQIAAATARPQDVVGAHFFSPAHVQKLLEVVRAAHTSPDVIATLMDLGRRMGKISVLSRIYPGFIGNALFRNSTREAHFLLEEGALPHQVDAALTGFGYAMGVFAVHDLAGNDVGYQTRKAQIATRPAGPRYNDIILHLCDLGRLGQKVGKGWYHYEPGSRTPQRDPAVEQFVVDYSATLGMTRREISHEEILKRCLYSMINEGARLLERGIALRASDIDIVYITGYGFPKERGGPMYLADHLGLQAVHTDIQRLHREQGGAYWEPSPLLARLARDGGRFADL